LLFVYIFTQPRFEKFYTGQTEDLEHHLIEHNQGKTAFMSSGMPWKLVWLTQLSTHKEAMTLEKAIKKRGAKRFLNDHQI
jgi:putative endonuclease